MNKQTLKTAFSGFDKLTATVLKMYYQKQNHKIDKYRAY